MPNKFQIILPKLEPWQREVWDTINLGYKGQVYVVKARRQVGKSILAEVLLIKFALERKTTSVIVEPTLNQGRRVFKQICDLLQGSGIITSANASLLTMEFINGSEILFKSAEQMEALRGMTVSGILVIDEAAFIPDEVFEILYPTVDANQAPMLIISTPLFTDGKYYELYNNKKNISFDWSKYDTSKFLSPEKLEQYRVEMSPNKFKSEYLGEFIEDGSFVFSNIRACVGEFSTKPSVFCGVDWAVGSNGDYTAVVMLDDDGHVTFLDYFNNIEPTEQIERIVRDLETHPELRKVQVEKNSIGNVFYDMLKRQYKKSSIIQLFNTDNESKRRIIEQLVSAFQQEKIQIPNDDETVRELNHYAVERTPTGKVAYNALTGYHDDIIMALAMAYDLIDHSTGAYVISMNMKKHKISLREKYG
jgi:hypothetical protein